MAQLVFGAVGAAAGFMVGGPAGAQIGWMVGSAIGGYVGQEDVHTEGPRIGDRTVTSSTLGTPMTVLYGTARLAGNVIDCSEIREVSTTTEQGKGGPENTSTTYTYNCDIAIDLCQGQILAIRKIFTDGKLTYDVSAGGSVGAAIASSANAAGFKLYTGTEAQMPDPTLEALQGVGNVPAYRGRAYVVFTGLDCPNARTPQMTFEVVKEGTLGSESLIYVALPGTNVNRASIAKDQIAQYESAPTSASKNYTAGSGYFIGPRVENYALFGGASPVPVQGSLYAMSREAAGSFASPHNIYVFDLADGSSQIVLTYIPGSAGNELSPRYAAYDKVTGKYCAVGGGADYRGSVITMMPSGLVTDVLQTYNTPMAFYDDVIYTCALRSGITYLRKYSGTTGLYLGEVSAGANRGSTQLLVYADEGGVFVLDAALTNFGIARSLWQVTDAGWELLTTGAFINNIGGAMAAFYANSSYAIIGPEYDGAAVTSNYRLIRYGVMQPTEPTVASIITDQCLLAGLAADQIDVTGLTDTVHGYPITRVSSARGNIQPLLKAFFIDPVEVDGKVKFIKRANAGQVTTISFDDLAASEDDGQPGDPFPLVRAQEDELPRSITVQFMDVAADYQAGAEQALRQVTQSINDIADDIAICTNSDHAKKVADVLLFDAWSGRNRRSGKLTRQFADLTPGDVALVEYPRGTFQSRLLTRVSDTGVMIEFEAIDANAELYQVAPPGAAGDFGQTVDALPPPSQMQLLDIPLLRDVDDNAGLYVAQAGLGANWRGAALYVGQDESSLAFRGSVDVAAPIGFAESALGNWLPNTIDESNTVVVNVGPDTLSSSTRAAILTGTTNACAIGAEGRWEVLQFIRASSLGGGRYLLSGFKRGQRGTELNCGNHQANDAFVLLVPLGLLRPVFDVAELGQTRKYRSVSNGLPLASVVSIDGINTGVGLKPLSPYNLRRSRTSGDLTITWARRTRLSDNWLTGLVPLGESSEAYQVDVYTSAAFTTVVRTLSVTARTAVYTSAQQVVDFGSAQAVVYVRIYQMSGAIGRGFSLQGSI